MEDVVEEQHSYEAEGVELESISGWCPVQAFGTVDGQAFYFRARGSAWRVEIGGKPEPEHEMPDAVHWSCGAPYGEPYEAGWMCPEHTRLCLDAAFAAYRARVAGQEWVDIVGVPTGPVVTADLAWRRVVSRLFSYAARSGLGPPAARMFLVRWIRGSRRGVS